MLRNKEDSKEKSRSSTEKTKGKSLSRTSSQQAGELKACNMLLRRRRTLLQPQLNKLRTRNTKLSQVPEGKKRVKSKKFGQRRSRLRKELLKTSNNKTKMNSKKIFNKTSNSSSKAKLSSLNLRKRKIKLRRRKKRRKLMNRNMIVTI